MGCLQAFVRNFLVMAIFLAILATLVFYCSWFQKKYIYPLPYKEIVFAVAEHNQIDPFLLYAVMRTESKYIPSATSPKGARGLMQIMPETGAWIAEQQKLAIYSSDMLYNPVISVDFGAWYLRSLENEFDGNLVLMIAAYNGGRGNVKQWKQRNYWRADFSDISQIPFTETRSYVAKVLDAYDHYKKLYGP